MDDLLFGGVMIDERALRAAYAELRARVAFLESHLGLYVPDEDLDRQYGDPVVRFDMKKWVGEPLKGKRFSECPPAFLDLLADYLSWAAANPRPGKEKYSEGNRKDAARARSWARRIRKQVADVRPAPSAFSLQDEDDLQSFLGGD